MTGTAAMVMAYASVAAMAVGTAVTAYSSYQAGKEAKRQGEAEAELARQQAAAQEAQAAEYERQAAIEKQKAGIEQLQGEQEAAAKMRQRAAQIGSTYATAAGNGILVSGSETDTFANVLKSQNIEDTADINTIKANTAMAVWSREEDARSLMFAAGQSRAGAQSSLFSSNEYARQGKSAYKAGVTSAIGSLISGSGSTGATAYNMFKK